MGKNVVQYSNNFMGYISVLMQCFNQQKAWTDLWAFHKSVCAPLLHCLTDILKNLSSGLHSFQVICSLTSIRPLKRIARQHCTFLTMESKLPKKFTDKSSSARKESMEMQARFNAFFIQRDLMSKKGERRPYDESFLLFKESP